jgi:hypothetical protein
MAGNTLHAEAVRYYKAQNYLSQKDLVERWGLASVRTVQRYRKEFNLKPISWWGINPLFSLEEVERVERLRNKKRMAMMRTKAASCPLITVKAAKRRAGGKAARRGAK